MPKVSVLMPVYKTDEKHLRLAIESILNQTFTDFEFLILDDCPADSREQVVASYQDKRIRYVQNKENMGIARARNKLIEMARGEYLAIFDHDDVSLPERFEKQVSFLDANPAVGVVGTATQRMFSKKVFRHPESDIDIKLSLFYSCAVLHPSAMIRKSVLAESGVRYEENFTPAEDYALWCRLIPYTKFHNLPDILFHYREHSDNTSHRQQNRMKQKTHEIRAWVQVENPSLYQLFVNRAYKTSKIKLFGIPFLTIVRRGRHTKGTLFGVIPLFTCKSNIRLKGK